MVVVVEIDADADVVQHAGRPQQPAIARVQAVRRLELVEQLQAERGHVAAVDAVAVEVARQVEHAELAQVVEHRLPLAGQEALVEDALAQSLLADGDALEAAVLQQGRVGQRAALDDVGAVDVQAGDLEAFLLAHAPEAAGHVLHAGRPQLVAVDRVQRKAGRRLVDAGQVAHRAAQRHQAVPRLGAEPIDRGQLLGQKRVEALHGGRLGPVIAQKQVAQPQRAQGQADRAPGSPPRTSTICALPPPRSTTKPSRSPMPFSAPSAPK